MNNPTHQNDAAVSPSAPDQGDELLDELLESVTGGGGTTCHIHERSVELEQQER